MTAVEQKHEEQNCPCCEHHCLSERLSCVRGMAHFERTLTEDWLLHHGHAGGGPRRPAPDAPLTERVTAALQQCGRSLHHGRGNRTEAGHQLSTLTEQEQEELLRLLEKVQNSLQQ